LATVTKKDDPNNDDYDSEMADAEKAMEDASLECKDKVTNNPFQLLTPMLLGNPNNKGFTRLIGKIDTACTDSCINKKTFLNKLNFSFDHIKRVQGNLQFLSSSCPRIGKTCEIKVKYLNDISFTHLFEVVDFDDELGDEFDVLLGIDILPRLRIGLTGVAHKYPEEGKSPEELSKIREYEMMQFENINFDTKNVHDPQNAEYGTETEREDFMSYIKEELNENQKIKSGRFCTVPESRISIPVRKDVNYYVPQYPLPHHAKPEIRRQLQEWLEAGIVEHCRPSGIHNSPLLVVPKNDSEGKPTKFRVCMDVRKINFHMPIQINRFEVPNIQDILSRVTQKGCIFTKIDLKNAYFSFEVEEESRDVLQFTFEGKTYRWVGCCFGLRHVTSVFSSVMHILFGDLEGCECYIDDLCITSFDIESHKRLVKEVIQRLNRVNLKIGLDKCAFMRSSIYLLGFVVGPGITKVDFRRLSNIHEWKPCKTAKQVKQLAGLISYLRTHIPMLSKLMQPIDSLRNCKDVEKNWTAMHTDRLERIKQVLLSSALLHAPDMHRKFYLETDASQYGASCALTQRDDYGRTKYIALLSKSFNQTQQNWPVLRRELYAIIFGLVKLRPVLYGHPKIEVLTDHKALIYTYTCKNPNRMLQSYMDILNEYPQLKFTHIPGLTNSLPDLLSRLYEPVDDSQRLEGGGNNDKRIIKLENRLQKLKSTKTRVDPKNKNDSSDTKDAFIKQKQVYSHDKKLHILAVKIKEHTYEGVTYVAPPEEERKKLLNEYHSFGHHGSYSIVKKLHSEGIHWSGLYDEAKEMCKACIQCARHNIVRRGYHGLKNIIAYAPFDHIGIDLLGPLPVTEQNNTYILVVIDVCTRYIIARPLPSKQSDHVSSALMKIFGDYGVPKLILQSDNGREMKNSLMEMITHTLGFEHRYSTAFHSRGNGVSESAVKSVENTLRKMVKNNVKNWDRILPACQLSINTKIRHRTESAPFALMFARSMNPLKNYDDPDNSIKDRIPMSMEELNKRADYMTNVVFPAINERTKRIAEEQAARFNKDHIIVDYQVGDWVMVRLPERAGKLEAAYEGPFQVVQKKKSTYVLKDEQNELLHRDYVPSELKLISIDETAIEDEVYEVDEIRDHRGPPMTREYLVKWKGYGERENTWEPASSFNNPLTIKKYWTKLREYQDLENKRKEELLNKSNTKSKHKPVILENKAGKRKRTSVEELEQTKSQRRSRRS
jgi:IS30 family transposase